MGRLDAPRVVPPELPERVSPPGSTSAFKPETAAQTDINAERGLGTRLGVPERAGARARAARGGRRCPTTGPRHPPSASAPRAGPPEGSSTRPTRRPARPVGASVPEPRATGLAVGARARSRARRARGLASSSTSAPRVDPTNVGFRMLRKAGWNVGEGLGKDKQGDTEPLRVWKKASRRGVGAECRASGHVVGEISPEKGNPTPHSRRPVSGARAADDDESPVEPRDATAARVARQARDRRLAADVGRAFREEEARADENPLLRRRREREEEEARRSKSGGKRRRAGDDLGGGMSANNPLRGLF